MPAKASLKSFSGGIDGRPMGEYSTAKSPASADMRRAQLQLRPERDDPRRVDLAVRAVIMVLDVINVHGRADIGILVQLAQIVRQMRVISDAALVAFEVAVLDGIEPHDGGEWPPIGPCQGFARQIELAPEAFIQPVQSFEQLGIGLFVRCLGGSEACLVHPIIDRVVHTLVDCVDLRPQRQGVKIGGPRADPVESAVQHPDDL